MLMRGWAHPLPSVLTDGVNCLILEGFSRIFKHYLIKNEAKAVAIHLVIPSAKAGRPWDPQTPYLKVLQYVPAGEKYNTYLKLKKEYGSTPSFYIDATDFFSKSMGRDTVVTILSNLAELEIESPQLLRVLGKKLIELKRYDEAILVFQKVLKLRGEEPQSYRDLGHVSRPRRGNFFCEMADVIEYKISRQGFITFCVSSFIVGQRFFNGPVKF